MENIEKEIISEWSDFYINYKLLQNILYPFKVIENNAINNSEKKEIKENIDNNNNINTTLKEELLLYNEQKEEENKIQKISGVNIDDLVKKYFAQLTLEIDKFSYFNNLLQTKRHSKRFDEIVEQLMYIDNHPTMKMFQDQLGESLKNLYRELSNYQLFIDTNIKIKNITLGEIEKYIHKINSIFNLKINVPNLNEKKNEINSILESANKYNHNFLKEIEEQYTLFFQNKYKNEKKSPIEILKNFLTPEKEKVEKDNIKILNILILIMFTLGMICFIVNYHLEIDIDEDPEFRSIFPMYRTYGIICLYLWFIGLNIKTWEDIKINYRALFSFKINKNSIINIWLCASVFCSFLFLAFLLYFITRTPIGINFGLNLYNIVDILPALIWLSLLLYFFCPFKILNYEGRNNVKKLFLECIASILIPIEFKHIWFMDQLTSLIGPMRDIEYTFCYYSYYVNHFETRQLYCSSSRVVYLIIAIFPNLFRCLQVGRQMIDNQKVFPYIFNIGKYTFNIIVATFSFLSQFHQVFYFFWLANAFISGCYSSFWDLKMDWGYFEGCNNFPLRKKNKFKNKFLCILSIPIDIILRFLWMLSISPEIMSQYIRPEFLALVLYTLEMIRRAIWNFIRVEFEHFELEKMYQISYYEELPLIKLSNGKFKTNENLLLNILDTEKKDRMILELRELFNSLDKDKKSFDQEKETSLNHLIEEKKYEKNMKNMLDEYLSKYNKDSNDNLVN